MLSRTPTPVANLALLVFSVLLALLAAELGVRLLWGYAPGNIGPQQLICEYDPLLGWHKIANARKRFTTPEYDILERINSKGLRGPELSYEKPPGVFRILVIGDSFTEGYTVEQDEGFTEVLRRALEAHWGQGAVQVVNGGTGGYSTDQELLFYRSEGKRYGADLVVLAFIHNDIWFNMQAEYNGTPKPLFQLREGELVLTNSPLPERSQTPRPVEDPERPSMLNRLKLTLSDHSALYGLVRARMRGTHWLYGAAIRLGLAEPPDAVGAAAIPIPDEWRIYERVPSAAVREAWTLTEALLLGLRSEVESAGARLLVVNGPPWIDLYENLWHDVERKYGIGEDAWSPSTATLKLEEICARNRIDLLDLTPAFAAAIEQGPDRPDPPIFPIDLHWTATGHRLAGETLAEYLAARHGPPTPPASGSSTRSSQISRLKG